MATTMTRYCNIHFYDENLTVLQASPQQPCTDSDPTCYCIPTGKCYPNKQVIEINNCDIDRYKGDNFDLELHYVVTNGAGQPSPEYTVEVWLI